MMRINQTFLKQRDGCIVILSYQSLLSQFQSAELILSAHLSFATFPWMELMSIQLLHRLLILSSLVKQNDFFQQKVITFGYQLRILLKMFQAHSMVVAQTLVQLIQLHQDTGIGDIKQKGLLHTLHSLLALVLLVEQSECEVTPYGRELSINFCRLSPYLHRHIILALVVIETAQIIRGLGILLIHMHGIIQCQNCLRTVREAVV